MKSNLLIKLVLILFVFHNVCKSQNPEIKIWCGNLYNSSNWQDANNWNPPGIPDANSIVVIGVNATIYYVPSVQIAALRITPLQNTNIEVNLIAETNRSVISVDCPGPTPNIFYSEIGLGTAPPGEAKLILNSDKDHVVDIAIKGKSQMLINAHSEFISEQLVREVGTQFGIEAVGFLLTASPDGHTELIEQDVDFPTRGAIEIYQDDDEWKYECIPFESLSVDPFDPEQGFFRHYSSLCEEEGAWVRFWDALNQVWSDFLGTLSCFDPILDLEFGKGFEIWIPNIKTNGTKKIFYGDFNNVPSPSFHPMPIKATQWNLLGNPFPSGIKFEKVGEGLKGFQWNKTDIDPWVCYWDNKINATRYYNWYTNVGIPPDSNQNKLPLGQGFFVYVNSPNAFLKINNDCREAFTYLSIGKTSPIAQNLLYMTLSNDSLKDDLAIYFHEIGSVIYNSGDIRKLFTNNSIKSELYCRTNDNIDICMNALKPDSGNIVVPVYMNVGKPGIYTLEAKQINSFTPKTAIKLIDNLTSSTIDLRVNPIYTFTANEGDNPARFQIIFTDVLNGINDENENKAIIYTVGKTIYIDIAGMQKANNKVIIYDLVGKELLKKDLYNTITKISTNLSNGWYIVSISSDQMNTIQKVYLN
jgi:hypothetical protein